MTADLITDFVTSTTPDRAEFLDRFREQGFTRDGEPAERPTEALTLYRGCEPKRRWELSWTTSRAVARRWGTSEGQLSPIGRLWVIEACPPGAMLATWSKRHEQEVLVDTGFRGVIVAPWTMREIKAYREMQRSEAYGVAAPQPRRINA